MSIFFKWLSAFSLLNILDYFVTVKSIKQGAIELNIIANYFIERNMLLHYKFLGLLILTFLLYRIAHRNNDDYKKVLLILKGGCIIYILIVLNNSIVYLIQS